MASVSTDDGFTVTSSDESAEDMRTALAAPEPADTPEPEPDPEPEPKPAAVEAKTDAKPVDKRTREGRKQSIQQEIDELTTAKHSTAREVESARAELERLRSELSSVSRPAQAAPALPDKFPSYEDALKSKADLTPEQWLDARDDWRDMRKAQQDAARSAEQTHQTRVQGFNEKIRMVEAAEPGFWESVNSFAATLVPARELPPGQKPTARNVIADVIIESDKPDALLKHFRDHPEDLQRISALPRTVDAFRQMGKLEARLEAASSTGPASQTPVVSQAKPPLKPVSGSPSISDDAPDDDEPFEKHYKRENARDPRLSHSAMRH